MYKTADAWLGMPTTTGIIPKPTHKAPTNNSPIAKAPLSERFFKFIGPAVGVRRDGSVNNNRFFQHTDNVYAGKSQLLPGVDITGLNRVARGTTQTIDANNTSEALKGLGQVGLGSLQALTTARSLGVGSAKALVSPTRFANSRFLGTTKGVAPTWATALPGGGTAIGQKLLNPVFSGIGKTLQGIDGAARFAFHPLSFARNLPQIARSTLPSSAANTLSRLSKKRWLDPITRHLNPNLLKSNNRLLEYATNVGSRLASPVSLYGGINSYANMGNMESFYANPMSRGEKLRHAFLGNIPQALNPYYGSVAGGSGRGVATALSRSLFSAPATDWMVHNQLQSMQKNHLDNLIPVIARTEEDQENRRLSLGDSYYSPFTSPLPWSYWYAANNRKMPIQVADGTSDFGTRAEISNLVQHNNRALAEFPVGSITNRNIAGLHNAQIDEKNKPPTNAELLVHNLRKRLGI